MTSQSKGDPRFMRIAKEINAVCAEAGIDLAQPALIDWTAEPGVLEDDFAKQIAALRAVDELVRALDR